MSGRTCRGDARQEAGCAAISWFWSVAPSAWRDAPGKVPAPGVGRRRCADDSYGSAPDTATVQAAPDQSNGSATAESLRRNTHCRSRLEHSPVWRKGEVAETALVLRGGHAGHSWREQPQLLLRLQCSCYIGDARPFTRRSVARGEGVSCLHATTIPRSTWRPGEEGARRFDDGLGRFIHL